MRSRFRKFAFWLWPDLQNATLERQEIGLNEVFGFLVTAPVALVGFVWLVSTADIHELVYNPAQAALALLGLFLLRRLRYVYVLKLPEGKYGLLESSLTPVLIWSSLLAMGQSAVWIFLIWEVISALLPFHIPAATGERWIRLRRFSTRMTVHITFALGGLWLYTALGGEIPFPGINSSSTLPGALAISVYLAGEFALSAGALSNQGISEPTTPSRSSVLHILTPLLKGFSIHLASGPFGMLAAATLTTGGLSQFIFLLIGLILVALFSHRWSLDLERNRQSNQFLRELEKLNRDLASSTPDRSSLKDSLNRTLPGMLPPGRLVLWTFPENLLYQQPKNWAPPLQDLWPWMLQERQMHVFHPGDPLPWFGDRAADQTIITGPILELESEKPIGGLYLELFELFVLDERSWGENITQNLWALLELISTSMYQMVVFDQQLEYQRVNQELEIAGDIQTSFMPYRYPSIPGWRLSVTLKPVGETSGDFFDIIPLSEGKIGLVIADVMDKGVGPALFSAISRTLLRTYTIETGEDPGSIFSSTNQRIILDTSANLYVTVFFGILDPETGVLQYANAGHPPPLLIRSLQDNVVRELIRTGIPIGLREEAEWETVNLTIQNGDLLVLYTDGIPDALNDQEERFTESRMIEATRKNLDRPIEELQEAILDSLEEFTQGALQFDDITLMLLARDAGEAD